METVNQIMFNSTLIIPTTSSLTNPLEESDEDTTTASRSLSLGSKRIGKKRNHYQRIDDNTRQKLIDAVMKDGQMLKSAAKKFNINYSSAKSIFHTYRKEGRINKKAVRARYLRRYPKNKKVIQDPSPIHSDSNSVPESENYQKQLPLDPLKIDIQKSLKDLQETQLSSSIMNYQFESFNFKQTLLPKMTNMNPTLINTPPFIQNINLMQYYMNQATMKRCEELKQLETLQNILKPSFPMTLEKGSVENVDPLNGYVNMMSLQNQMQSVPHNLGNIESQTLPYMGTAPYLNGFPTFRLNPSGNVLR